MPAARNISSSLARSWGSVAFAGFLFLAALIVYMARSHDIDLDQRQDVAEAEMRVREAGSADLEAKVQQARTKVVETSARPTDKLLMLVPEIARNDFIIALLVACATQLMTTILFAKPFEDEIDTRLDAKLSEFDQRLDEFKGYGEKVPEFAREIRKMVADSIECTARDHYLRKHDRTHSDEYLSLIEDHCVATVFYRKNYYAKYAFSKENGLLKLIVDTSYLVKNVTTQPQIFTPQLVYAKAPLIDTSVMNAPRLWRVNKKSLLPDMAEEIARQVKAGAVHIKLAGNGVQIPPGGEVKVELRVESWRRDDDEEIFVCIDPCDGLEVEVEKLPGLDIEIASICVGEFATDQDLREPKPNSLVWTYSRPTLPLNGYQVTWRTARPTATA